MSRPSGRLRFLPVGDVGGAYPTEIRAGRRRPGVYAIRDKVTRELLYVGMSTKDVYRTATRHLQSWDDRRGSHGGRHHWHVTFRRKDVEVALRLTLARNTGRTEANWICRLRPKFNRRDTEHLLDPPF